tara:strand:- start:77054 stop:77326 length:273 start_codon:yes stop_codon:yes gene_type:complete
MTNESKTTVSKDTSTAAPSDAPQATPSAPQQSTELTIQDLSNLKQIIDVASGRGAFKPNEMMTVGSTYSKLETFLNAVAQQPAPAEKKGE